MEFPLPLRTAIEQKAQDSSTAELIREAQGLSQRYREESGQGKRLVPTDRQAFVYAAVRMPATFGAVAAALNTRFPFWKTRPPLFWMSAPVPAPQPGRRTPCCRWNRFPAWNGSPLWPGWANH